MELLKLVSAGTELFVVVVLVAGFVVTGAASNDL